MRTPWWRSAAELLGQIGSADLLIGDAEPSPLVRTAGAPDTRVRFAALDSILKLKPTRPFPRPSCVGELLARFIATRGVRRAMVVSPSGEEAARLAGMLGEAGFDVDTATTGRALFNRLGGAVDCELVLLDARLQGPTAGETLAALRQDPLTRLLPVGLVASGSQRAFAEAIVRGEPRADFFIRPTTSKALGFEVSQLLCARGARYAQPRGAD